MTSARLNGRKCFISRISPLQRNDNRSTVLIINYKTVYTFLSQHISVLALRVASLPELWVLAKQSSCARATWIYCSLASLSLLIGTPRTTATWATTYVKTATKWNLIRNLCLTTSDLIIFIISAAKAAEGAARGVQTTSGKLIHNMSSGTCEFELELIFIRILKSGAVSMVCRYNYKTNLFFWLRIGSAAFRTEKPHTNKTVTRKRKFAIADWP